MIRRPPRSTLTYTLLPDTTLCRSGSGRGAGTSLRSRCRPCPGGHLADASQAIGSIGGATTAECQPYCEGLPTNLPWQLPTEGLPRQTLCQAVLQCLFA